jgi:hypothetical protein
MRHLEQGSGQVYWGETIRLVRPTASENIYSNAQIDDYSQGMLHNAPLHMSLTAVFSHSLNTLKGTAGFGFWNAPFEIGTNRFRFPKTAWFFFGSPPLNLPFALGIPGHGFKAATLDATHPLFFALLPSAPVGFLLMRIPPLYRRLWRIAQYAIRASEHSLDLDITQPHHYRLDWLKDRVIFSIDEAVVHTSPYSPSGKMGFVAWIDNQYAILTPQGNFGWGVLAEPEPQWLEISHPQITTL